jgi:hypothetical protein
MKMILLLFWSVSLRAGTLSLDPTSAIGLEGTSTLHRFSARSQALSLTATARPQSGQMLRQAIAQGRVDGLDLSLPVESLKSGDGGLDRNMDKALESDRYPLIAFHLETYGVTDDSVEAYGLLTLHGQAKSVTLTATIQQAGRQARLKGETKLNMEDFGVKPPVLMLGTLKVGKDVKVSYDLLLNPF